MKAILWLVLLLLAAVGVAAILDLTEVVDVPKIEVSKEMSAEE
jgi:hypothetical protein